MNAYKKCYGLLTDFLSFLGLDDQFITALTLCPGLETAGVLTVTAAWLSTGSLSFTSTHRVINRVHRYTTNAGADASPTVAAGLTHALQAVIAVGHNAYGRIAIDEDLSELTGRHFEYRVGLFLFGELG